MMKKYEKPEMVISEVETALLAASIGVGGVTDSNADRSIERRGTWGNIWSE